MKKIFILFTLYLMQALLVLQANGSGVIMQQVNDSTQITLYIKGPIGIFGSSLASQGSVKLDTATIVGDGSLLLCGSSPQQLYSSQSVVNNIVIDNPSKVTLSGDLTIAVSLTIEQGVFDASQAALLIDDTATVSIKPKAKFIKPIVQYTNSFPFLATVHSYNFDTCFLSYLSLVYLEPFLKKADVKFFVADNYTHLHNHDLLNPPEALFISM